MKNVRTISFVAVVLFLCACPALGVVEFKDGLTHNINYTINDRVYVDYQTPSMYTTVNVLDGASIYWPYDLRGYEHSRINIRGGYIEEVLYSYDSSQVNVSGGWISWIGSGGSSQVTISDGDIGLLESWESSQLNISGGSIGDWLYSYGSSQVNISGGSIGGDLMLWNQSMIQIFGSNFAVDGQSVGFGELTSIFGGWPWDEPIRHLTGTLLSGELINNGFHIGHEARIILIPEPATLTLLGIGSLFFRKRRK